MVQWLAIVGPPVAAFAQQQISYSLVSPACGRGAPILLHLPSLVMLAIIAGLGVYSWRQWTSNRDSRVSDDGEVARSRFFALLGLGMAGISGVLLLAQWLPTLFLSPCLP